MPDSNSNQPILPWTEVWFRKKKLFDLISFYGLQTVNSRNIYNSIDQTIPFLHLQFRCCFKPWIFSFALIYKFTFIVWPFRIISNISESILILCEPFFFLPMTSKRKNKMLKSEFNERLLSISDCILRAKMCLFSSLIRFPSWKNGTNAEGNKKLPQKTTD